VEPETGELGQKIEVHPLVIKTARADKTRKGDHPQECTVDAQEREEGSGQDQIAILGREIRKDHRICKLINLRKSTPRLSENNRKQVVTSGSRSSTGTWGSHFCNAGCAGRRCPISKSTPDWAAPCTVVAGYCEEQGRARPRDSPLKKISLNVWEKGRRRIFCPGGRKGHIRTLYRLDGDYCIHNANSAR